MNSSPIQVYEAKLVISTEYTGLKHLIYHYPVTTALIVISSNLSVLLVIFGFFRVVVTGVLILR